MDRKDYDVLRKWHDVPAFQKLEFQVSLALDFLEALNCARALTIAIMLRYEAYEEIVNLEVDPLGYNEPDDFRNAYLATEYLSKSAWLPLSRDREQLAYERFLKSEETCKETNDRFRDMWRDPLRADPELSAVFHLAQRKISDILGPLPKATELDFSFGPGSTSSTGGDRTSFYEKFRSVPDCTINCLPLVHLVEQFPCWLDSLPSQNSYRTRVFGCLVEGSKLLFVPKSAKIDRAICVEPHLNSFFQMGIGRFMRRRLERAGCDLSDQSVNQWLAKFASKSGQLATVDLSAASDTISYNLVLDLLPEEWFKLLDAARSPKFTYKGETRSLEKFSSMGNGFTFELESLIFLALIKSVCKVKGVSLPVCSTYGDDIIIPVEAIELLQRVLDFCGFSMNAKKSFWTSRFRESCGSHWFNGLCCKPIYFKEGIKNVQQLVKYTNGIRRVAYRNLRFGCDRRFRSCWVRLIKLLSLQGFNLRGPEGFGDGHIICCWDECRPSAHIRRMPYFIEGWRVRSVLTTPETYAARDARALYTYALFTAGAHKASSSDEIAYRRRSKTTIGHIVCPSWTDLGPWC